MEKQSLYQAVVKNNAENIRRLQLAVKVGAGYEVVINTGQRGRPRFYEMTDVDIARAQKTIENLTRPYTDHEFDNLMYCVRICETNLSEHRSKRSVFSI